MEKYFYFYLFISPSNILRQYFGHYIIQDHQQTTSIKNGFVGYKYLPFSVVWCGWWMVVVVVVNTSDIRMKILKKKKKKIYSINVNQIWKLLLFLSIVCCCFLSFLLSNNINIEIFCLENSVFPLPLTRKLHNQWLWWCGRTGYFSSFPIRYIYFLYKMQMIKCFSVLFCLRYHIYIILNQINGQLSK